MRAALPADLAKYCNIINICKHFVSFALPEELADGYRKALAAARSSSWLKVPLASQLRRFAPIDLGS